MAITKVTVQMHIGVELAPTLQLRSGSRLSRGGTVFRQTFLRRVFGGTLVLGLAVYALCPPVIRAQEEITRKVKTKTQPTYPELAKRMSISGVVRLQIVVAVNGAVKNTKVLGGHPLLASAACDAIKKWRFEAGSEETTGVVEFKFTPPEQ
jgi:TonB family protein